MGTTGGWKHIDATLREALLELGVTVEQIAIKRPRGGLIRRAGSPLNDLYEALSSVGATRDALRRVAPRAIIYSSSHAALLQPARAPREAVWIDGPIALMRPETRNAPLRLLERMRQRRLDLVMPMSLQHPDSLAGPLRPRKVAMLHMPVEPSDPGGSLPPDIKPPYGVMYAGAPGKKGLDIALDAWRLASPGMPLVVTGLNADEAERFLGHAVPAEAVFTGRVARSTHRRLVFDAQVYVSASRREEYGTAQLEALTDGTPLAAVPSRGAVEPVAVARRLVPNLVADEFSARALAGRISEAVAMNSAERSDYANAAMRLMQAYTHDAFKVRLREQVLPVLLD